MLDVAELIDDLEEGFKGETRSLLISLEDAARGEGIRPSGKLVLTSRRDRRTPGCDAIDPAREPERELADSTGDDA